MDFQLILKISIVVVIIACVFIGSFAGNMQAMTLWVGKMIAPPDSDKELPRGFQDAITPKYQDNFNIAIPVMYLLILIGGSFIFWYLGAVLLIITFVAKGYFRKIWRYDGSFYLKWIIFSMNNKIADYAKNNDSMRVEAGKEVLEQLQMLYEEIKNLNMKIPSFSDIKNMPNGSNVFSKII